MNKKILVLLSIAFFALVPDTAQARRRSKQTVVVYQQPGPYYRDIVQHDKELEEENRKLREENRRLRRQNGRDKKRDVRKRRKN